MTMKIVSGMRHWRRSRPTSFHSPETLKPWTNPTGYGKWLLFMLYIFDDICFVNCYWLYGAVYLFIYLWICVYIYIIIIYIYADIYIYMYMVEHDYINMFLLLYIICILSFILVHFTGLFYYGLLMSCLKDPLRCPFGFSVVSEARIPRRYVARMPGIPSVIW